MSHRLVLAAVAALGLTGAAGAAQAQVTVSVRGGNPTIASYYQIGHCLDVGNNNVIMYATCNSGRGAQGWRFVSGGAYGMISLGNQTCLQANAAGAALTAAICTNADNQKWSYTAGTGELRNQQASLCADVEGGNRASGGRIVAYRCQGSMNQKWYLATSGGTATYQISARTPMTSLPPGRALATSRGISSSNIVAGGAGNLTLSGGQIIAGGAGNIVAGGAGNIIAASILAGGAGNVVAAGNLIANDGASLRSIAPGNY